jgi:hypothetical protein
MWIVNPSVVDSSSIMHPCPWLSSRRTWQHLGSGAHGWSRSLRFSLCTGCTMRTRAVTGFSYHFFQPPLAIVGPYVGQPSRLCHTRLSEENQVHTYMHARIKFHAYNDIKVNTETVSRMKKKDYQRFTLYPGNEGSKHHRQSTGGYVRLDQHIFIAASSF